MQTPAQILLALGGPSRVARRLGLADASRVVKWGRRQSIPVKAWPTLIELARELGLEGVSADSLMLAHSGTAASLRVAA